MKRNIYIILIFISNLVYSQNQEYYRLINKAELCIIDGNYKEALKNYNLCFSSANEAKTVDIVNALKCSFLTEDSTTISYCLRQLLGRGLSYDDFAKDSFFNRKLRIKKIKEMVSVIFSGDSDYREEIRILDVNDQRCRLKGRRKKDIEKIQDVDRKNIETLLHLIKEKGFPSESRIGVLNLGGYQGWEIVVLHYNQKRSKKLALPDTFLCVLDKALKNREISPLKYCQLLAVANDPDYIKYEIIPLIILKKGEFRIGKKILNSIDSINKKRAKIGLCSMRDYVKKIIFQDDNRYGFYFEIPMGYYDLRSLQNKVKGELIKKTVPINKVAL